MELINKVYNHSGLRRILGTIRIPIGGIFIFLILFYGRLEMYFLAFTISFFGELIQIWSSGCLDKNEVLTIRGPYCLVRNPMYLGRFLVILGAVILLRNIYIMVIYLIAYYYYMLNRVKREERRLKDIFGEPYIDYCSKVNRFIPNSIACEKRDLLFFQFHLLIRNNEHLNFLALLSFYVIFYVFSIIS